MNLNERLIRVQRTEKEPDESPKNVLRNLVAEGRQGGIDQKQDAMLKKKIIDKLVQDLAAD
ncbi:MAG: hypothetical protein GX352_06490, partial [Clostridiales bacterium]|nr:hypothetical protein [Clostridiales bacterium]